jgi:ubiquinone/menaquinone biosynthesis C-methylase UbiE
MASLIEFQHINRINIISKIYSKWLLKGMKVLDVGCGDGVLAHEISRKLNLVIHGCDIDKYLYKKIPFTFMEDKSVLPFKGNTFDVATFNDVLHHTDYNTQENLIREALRVSKKFIIINEIKPNIGVYIEDLICNKTIHPKMEVPWTFRKMDDWLKLFKKFRVNVDYTDYPRPTFSLVSHIIFRLSKNY